MKLFNKHKSVTLVLEDSLIQEVTKLGLQSFPNECGGFLVGHYSEDFMTLYVTDLILPSKQKSSSVLFERSIVGLKEVLQKLYTINKHYYIGEWHTHPKGTPMYSQTDLRAMIKIASYKTVNIENPILLIMGIKKNLQELAVYLYDDERLFRYEQN